MAPLYSHSRLSTFENCPFQYRLKYVDRTPPTLGPTIEAYMGSRVHDALEWLYGLAMRGRVASEAELLAEFERGWEARWDSAIRVVREGLDPDHFR